MTRYDDTTPQSLSGLVADLDALRDRTRRHGQAWWFPLTVFGALVLLSLPLHVGWSRSPDGGTDVTYSFWESAVIWAWGAVGTPNAVLTGLYWFLALSVGYVLTGLFYRRHALATGLRRPVRWFVALGLAITVLLLPLKMLFWFIPLWRTTTALVIVLITVVVLAVRERDRVLWMVTAVLAVVTVVVNFYDVENLFFDLGVPFAVWWVNLPNVALPGLVLLAGGLIGLARRQRAGVGA